LDLSSTATELLTVANAGVLASNGAGPQMTVANDTLDKIRKAVEKAVGIAGAEDIGKTQIIKQNTTPEE
jgi:hypothetical protein